MSCQTGINKYIATHENSPPTLIVLLGSLFFILVLGIFGRMWNNTFIDSHFANDEESTPQFGGETERKKRKLAEKAKWVINKINLLINVMINVQICLCISLYV